MIAALAAAGFALAAATVGAQPIRVGELNSYKSQPAFLDPYKKGWELALEEINAAGGVLGRKMEVISRDDNGNPGDAVRVAEELVSREKADVIFGTFLSHIGLAVTDFAKQRKVLFLAAEPLTDKVTWQNGNRYTYRLRPSTYMQAAMLVPEAAMLKKKRWAIVYPNYEYGQSAVATFKKLLKQAQPDVEFVAEQAAPLGKVDAGSVVQARVRGSSYRVYQTVVRHDAVTGEISTSCSCPVHTRCKHAAALVWHMRLVNVRALTPAWQRALTEVTAGTTAVGRGEPLAMQVTRTSGSIQLRPLQWGRSGRWVKAGVSWDNLQYPWSGSYVEAQRVAMAGLGRTRDQRSTSNYYYSRRSDDLDLSELGSPAWYWLREVVASGVELVPGRDTPAVRLGEPAHLVSRLTRTDDGAALDIADLVRYIAKGLVDKPDEVHVALVEERQASVYELEVAESDLGKIIGRGGKTARALRTLVTQVAPRSKKRILVEILE